MAATRRPGHPDGAAYLRRLRLLIAAKWGPVNITRNQKEKRSTLTPAERKKNSTQTTKNKMFRFHIVVKKKGSKYCLSPRIGITWNVSIRYRYLYKIMKVYQRLPMDWLEPSK